MVLSSYMYMYFVYVKKTKHVGREKSIYKSKFTKHTEVVFKVEYGRERERGKESIRMTLK